MFCLLALAAYLNTHGMELAKLPPADDHEELPSDGARVLTSRDMALLREVQREMFTRGQETVPQADVI